MQNIIILVGLIFAISTGAQVVRAEAETLTVTVAYRERIALPPDAHLDVQLLDVAQADDAERRIASQRFLMTQVPMAVELPFDPQIINNQSEYAIVATIWSGDTMMFRTTTRHNAFSSDSVDGIEVLLTMVPVDDNTLTVSKGVAGVEWGVTEVMGDSWRNDDQATLTIDDEMNFSVFGGCNRFSGQLTLNERTIAFPQNFAGTLMACPDDIEAMERRLLDALARATGYVRYGAGLVLTDTAGHALLHFEEHTE
jgi:putative lipoprotein